MTSNYAPDGLYPDGLHRDRMLPAIALLKEKLDVLNVDAGMDYRKRVIDSLSWPELRDDAAPVATLSFPFSGRLAVSLRFYPPNAVKRDLDNLPKAVLDALTHAGLWIDDAQIDCLMLARVGVSPDRPRVVVRVWRYAPSELDLPLMEMAA